MNIEPEEIEQNRRRACYDKREGDRRYFEGDFATWICPACGVCNEVRTTLGGYGHIITPRIYHCHNHACHVRRFYYREDGAIFARYIGKYDSVDEIAFADIDDPVKFYDGLKFKPAPNQLSFL